MAETSWPYDSAILGYDGSGNPIYDRAKSADFLAGRISGLYTDGILYRETAESEFTNLQVTPGNGLHTYLDIGSAIVAGHMYENDAQITLTHDAAHASLARYDAVVIRHDNSTSVRAATAMVLKGTPSANAWANKPSLTRNSTIYDIAVAFVLIPAGSTQITSEGIVDKRTDGVFCGISTPTIDPPNMLKTVAQTITEAVRTQVYTNLGLAECAQKTVEQMSDALSLEACSKLTVAQMEVALGLKECAKKTIAQMEVALGLKECAKKTVAEMATALGLQESAYKTLAQMASSMSSLLLLGECSQLSVAQMVTALGLKESAYKTIAEMATSLGLQSAAYLTPSDIGTALGLDDFAKYSISEGYSALGLQDCSQKTLLFGNTTITVPMFASNATLSVDIPAPGFASVPSVWVVMRTTQPAGKSVGGYATDGSHMMLSAGIDKINDTEDTDIPVKWFAYGTLTAVVQS